MILNNPTTMLWGVIASSVVMGLLAVVFAAWQIGYRESGRPTGKIYCHHIDISTSYPNPFSLKNVLDL